MPSRTSRVTLPLSRVSSTMIGLAVILGTSIGSARSVVAPPNFANQEGSNDSSSLFEGATVIQVAYGPSLLTGLAPGQQITGIQFRANGNVSQSAPLSDYRFSHLDIALSTSTRPPGSLSTTNFASNVGLDVVKVRTGPFVVPAASFPASASPGPEPFGFLIPFTNPYTYQGGTLLLEVRALGDSAPFLTDLSDNLGTTLAQRLVGFSYIANGGINLTDCVDVVQFQVKVMEDLNGDGSVDAADAGVMFASWGVVGSGIVGDLNQDKVVDAADAGQLFAAWTGDSLPVQFVPEPGFPVLLLALATLRCWRGSHG